MLAKGETNQDVSIGDFIGQVRVVGFFGEPNCKKVNFCTFSKSPFCRHFFLLLTTILCESDVGCNQMVIIKVLRWALDRDTEIGWSWWWLECWEGLFRTLGCDFGDFDRVSPGKTEFSSGRIVLARQSWTTEPLGSGWFGQIQVRTTKNPGSVTESNLTKIGLSKSIFLLKKVCSTLRRNSFVKKTGDMLFLRSGDDICVCAGAKVWKRGS